MPKKKVTEAVEETAQETIPVEKAPGQMPRRQGSEDLLELNDLERGVTCEDIRVEMESDGRAEIYMSDGTMFRCDHFDASQLYGTNEKKEGATSLHLQEELRYDQSHSMST